mmetsp:Transcript_45615/g.111023  ORF Transcript_45615/g.111023 Transcript_45615/m.111023 type:complete len:222 (-) Transcript_45615:718-1383(-)
MVGPVDYVPPEDELPERGREVAREAADALLLDVVAREVEVLEGCGEGLPERQPQALEAVAAHVEGEETRREVRPEDRPPLVPKLVKADVERLEHDGEVRAQRGSPPRAQPVLVEDEVLDGGGDVRAERLGPRRPDVVPPKVEVPEPLGQEGRKDPRAHGPELVIPHAQDGEAARERVEPLEALWPELVGGEVEGLEAGGQRGDDGLRAPRPEGAPLEVEHP